jgi:diaminohydroxyphosphoribosylaminopyrimidine deaminase/5-amino-6-(5-phosphoribosylamino)uracil reductase
VASTTPLDDPQLTARPGGVTAERQPLRVVADSRGRTPIGAKVLGPGGRTLIATTDASPAAWRTEIAARGAEALVLPDDGGRVDLRALMRELGERGVLSLLVEGGGVLHAGFFAAGLADKVHAIIAPKIVGGTAYPAVAGEGAARISDALTLRTSRCRGLRRRCVVGYVKAMT